MADSKISALTDGSTVQVTDQIPVNRAGANVRVVVGTAATQPSTAFAAASHTHAQSEVTNLVSDLAAKVAASAYTAATQLTLATARLLGRTTAGTGAAEEISIGSGLTLSAGVLSTTGAVGIIDGESATFAGLPSASSSTGQLWTVYGSSGVYFINRKEAGIYRSDGTNWNRLGSWESMFSDDVLTFSDDADPTKKAMLQLSGITTGTTRVLAVPNASTTLVGRDTTDTLTNKTLTSPVVNSPTGIVKGDVGLGNVDNTSDATKNAASATLTNKTINGSNNTLTNVPAAGILGVIPIANLATGTPTGAKFVRDDGTLQTPSGATPTTTEGDLIVRGASADQRLAVGTTGQMLVVDTAVSGKTKWVDLDLWSTTSGTTPTLTFTATPQIVTLTTSGNTTFTLAGMAQGRRLKLLITADALRTLAHAATHTWLECASTGPTTIASGKVMEIDYLCTGTTAASVVATYAVQS